MTSIKTTICGLLVLIGTLIVQFLPEYSRYGAFAAALGTGLGLMFARDNSVTSEQAGAKPLTVAGQVQNRSNGFALLELLFAIACFSLLVILFTGCARFVTKQTDTSYEKGQPVRSITTQAKATTFFDAKSQLAQFKATQTDKTQSAAVGSLNQESSGSNVVSLAEALARGLAEGSVKGAKAAP